MKSAVRVTLALALLARLNAADSFNFVLLGDRTGDAQPGVYERVWQAVAKEKPAFVLGAGDCIEGADDAKAESQWREFLRELAPFRKIAFYVAPGNHDVWSDASALLFERNTGRPLHYSFDYHGAHFTVLDTSRSDKLSSEEMAFLEADLKAHSGQSMKVIASHRPWWLLDAATHNPDAPLQRLAKQYGVHTVVAGHVHQMLHIEYDGVTYISLPSAGGHLRLSGAYRDGWFFGYLLATAQNGGLKFTVKEAGQPIGQGRVTGLGDWGMTGLVAAPGR